MEEDELQSDPEDQTAWSVAMKFWINIVPFKSTCREQFIAVKKAGDVGQGKGIFLATICCTVFLWWTDCRRCETLLKARRTLP